MEGSSYGWEDRNSKTDPFENNEPESYNLYDKLIRNPYLRHYHNVNK